MDKILIILLSTDYHDFPMWHKRHTIIEFPTQQRFLKINVQVHYISHQGHSSLQCGYYNIDHHQCKNINLAKKEQNYGLGTQVFKDQLSIPIVH
jgi:hypothetical protein